MELNKEIIELLNTIKNLDKKDQEKLETISKKLSLLEKKEKQDLITYIILTSLDKIDEMLKNNEFLSCEITGHTFSEWECNILPKYSNEKENVHYWKRKCTKCNLVDVSSVDPRELENIRNK